MALDVMTYGGRTMLAMLVGRDGRFLPRLQPRSIVAAGLALGLVALLAALLSAPALAAGTRIQLTAGPGAPGAAGTAQLELEHGVLKGSVNAHDLPSQAFGTGRFYGVWFVRTDTGDKAFLGALAQDESIILAKGGPGRVEFAATQFTAGPDAGSPIRFGPASTNQVLVLIENNINGLTPSPVGPVRGTGVALSGAF
jgi:hypothetical protein